MVEESQQRKRKSEANLYVVPFGRYNLSETMPLSMMKRLDEEVPPVFMILDTFDKDVKASGPCQLFVYIFGKKDSCLFTICMPEWIQEFFGSKGKHF